MCEWGGGGGTVRHIHEFVMRVRWEGGIIMNYTLCWSKHTVGGIERNQGIGY